MSAFLRRYLARHPEHDDIDSIAAAMRAAVRAGARFDRDGVLEMLEHPAALEIDAFDTVVAYPEMIDALHEPAHAALRLELVPALRERLSAKEPGVRQRARYALVRLLGAESEEAREGLESGEAASEAAVLAALVRGDAALPEALQAPLERLVRRGKGRGPGADAFFLFEAPLVRAVLRLPRAEALLVAMLEDTDLRVQLGRALDRGAVRLPTSVLPSLRARFARAAEALVHPPAGSLPSRNELSIAATIARLAPHDAEIGARAAGLLDALLSLARMHGLVKRQLSDDATRAMLAAIEGSLDTLDPASLVSIAGHLAGDWRTLFPLAGRAWARLGAREARSLAARVRARPEHADARREAMAEGVTTLPTPRPEIAALLVEELHDRALTDGLGAALTDAPIEPLRLEDLIRRARNTAELTSALELACTQRATHALRAILEKLREGPFRIDRAIETQLASLVDEDNEIWLEAEIDGENPFRDRREALARVRDAAR